jgi:hypothetical protein
MTATTALPAFVRQLEETASAAQAAELAFRNNLAREIARLERERQFAFRRAGLARTLALAVASAKDEDEATAAQHAVLANEFGWRAESEHRRKVFAAWTPVASAIWADTVATRGETTPASTASPADALRDFEAWYLATFGTNYLAILDHEMPEIPVVEF